MSFYSVVRCDTPPTITDGSTNCATGGMVGYTCTANCDRGFHMTGTETLTCQDNNGVGEFTEAPTCIGLLVVFSI